ncbi:MAG: GAF domain-containing protein [Verrucomicrobia bacterium]|nr:GAF domain-containing protein [Verrucomicrobiota bacterium]
MTSDVAIPSARFCGGPRALAARFFAVLEGASGSNSMAEHGTDFIAGSSSQARPVSVAETVNPPPEQGLSLVSQIFRHRLRQEDVERILAALSTSDRVEFVSKIGDLLRRVSALLDVYNRIADVLSLDLLLKRLIEIITEALNADRSTLYLYDPETRELFSRIAQGDLTQEIRFPSHLGIAGSVFTSGGGVIIKDAYSDPRFNQEVDRKTGYHTRNILCTALRNKKRELIGVSQVLNKAEVHFSIEDMAMLEAITTQAAAAIENAQLHDKVERARREEEKMLEVAKRFPQNSRSNLCWAKSCM